MQKLFDASVDYPLARLAANEEFPSAKAPESERAQFSPDQARGWSAYEIWHSRIRLLPGVISLFLTHR